MSTPDMADLHQRIGTQLAPYITGSRYYQCDYCERMVTHVVCLANMPHGRQPYGQFCPFCLPKVQAQLNAK